MTDSRTKHGVRITFFGLAINAFLAAAKLAAGVVGHSHALMADAIESLADVFSSLIVWRGLVVAAVPADADHPYGHGKAEPLAAAIVSTFLLLAAVGISYRAVDEIIKPQISPAPFTLVVLLVVVVVKETVYRRVIRAARDLQSSVILTDAWHHRSDAITSLAAATGIAVALIGGPDFAVADDFAALVAAGIIAWNGWRLLRPAMDELMDAKPSNEVIEQIRSVAATVSGVDHVEKCVVRKMGYHYLADLHVEVDPQMSVQDAHRIAHEVKDEVRRQRPSVHDVLVHIEPTPDGGRAQTA